MQRIEEERRTQLAAEPGGRRPEFALGIKDNRRPVPSQQGRHDNAAPFARACASRHQSRAHIGAG